MQSSIECQSANVYHFFLWPLVFLLHSLKPEKISDYHWAPSWWQHACPDQLRSWKPAVNPMATESPTHQTQHKKECHGPMGQQLQIVSQRWRPWNQSFYTVFEANGQITCPWFPIRMSLEDCHPVRHTLIERPLFNFVHLQFAPLFPSNVHFFTVPFSLISMWVRRASRKNSPSNSWRSEGIKRVYYIPVLFVHFFSAYLGPICQQFRGEAPGASNDSSNQAAAQKSRLPCRRSPRDPWPLYHHLGNQAIKTNRSYINILYVEYKWCREILDVLDLFEYLMIFTYSVSICWWSLWVIRQATQRPGAILALTQQCHLVIPCWDHLHIIWTLCGYVWIVNQVVSYVSYLRNVTIARWISWMNSNAVWLLAAISWLTTPCTAKRTLEQGPQMTQLEVVNNNDYNDYCNSKDVQNMFENAQTTKTLSKELPPLHHNHRKWWGWPPQLFFRWHWPKDFSDWCCGNAQAVVNVLHHLKATITNLKWITANMVLFGKILIRDVTEIYNACCLHQANFEMIKKNSSGRLLYIR